MRRLIANACCAYAAWVEAGLCASAARHGFAVGILMLFFCLLANRLFKAWLTGR